jgi:hypothetical protein
MHKNIQEFVDSFFFFLKCFFFKSWMLVPKQFTDKMNYVLAYCIYQGII